MIENSMATTASPSFKLVSVPNFLLSMNKYHDVFTLDSLKYFINYESNFFDFEWPKTPNRRRILFHQIEMHASWVVIFYWNKVFFTFSWNESIVLIISINLLSLFIINDDRITELQSISSSGISFNSKN